MAQLQLTLEQQQYEALIALAREGTKDAEGNIIIDKALKLDAFLRSIEKDNGITRSGLWVQWQEADQPLPPTTDFPNTWPPEMRFYIELVTRLVSRADVDAVLEARARKPVNVLITKDPAARAGWTPIDSYPFK